MSQPTIPNLTPTIKITREETINVLLASIALDALATAHIDNAQAEALQLLIGTLTESPVKPPSSVSIPNLIKANKNVHLILQDTIKKEILLQFKFENILELIEEEHVIHCSDSNEEEE